MLHARQKGMTLVEFMVAIVIGMILVAALATLIANQSQSRAEIDKVGKMIENGRYAVQVITNDLQMAGYYGETSTTPAVPASMPDPCSTTLTPANDPNGLQVAMGLHVQGYDGATVASTSIPSCVKNHKAGTDILVVRHAEPEAIAIAAATKGEVYLQTGLDASGLQFASVMAAAEKTSADDSTFSLKKRDPLVPAGVPAGIRKYSVHIYYISECSVVNGSGTCTGNVDGGTAVPTLKRVDLMYTGGGTSAPSLTCSSCIVSIAEGIENMRIDYGVDVDGDGYPDGANQNGGAFTAADWANVTTATVHLIARGTETAPGFTDTNSYKLGTAEAASAPSGQTAYRRRVFVQTARMVNPIGRRSL